MTQYQTLLREKGGTIQNYTRPQANMEHIPGKLGSMVPLSSDLTMLTALATSRVLTEHGGSQTPPKNF